MSDPAPLSLPYGFARQHGVVMSDGCCGLRPDVAMSAVAEVVRIAGPGLHFEPLSNAQFETRLAAAYRDNAADASAAGSKRRLLEIGTAGEHTGGTVDPFIRHRLLSKIAGNTTTRSNCFAIFISVKYFEAVEDNTTNPAVPAVRIGGPFNGKPEPEHRGFFIVDRSKLENGQTSGGTRYDFRDFVEYRKTLQTQ